MEILLADDHALFRDGIVTYITHNRPDINISTAEDYPSAKELIQNDNKFDLIMLDLCMPGMNGFEGLKDLIKTFPDISVAIISGIAQSKDIDECMSCGASGFFPKTLSGSALIKAIELVVEGERFIPVDYTEPPQHISAAATLISFNCDIPLTQREKEVMSYLIKGETNQDIADHLNLKVVTIKLYVKNICRKLNVKNRTQAALYGVEIAQAEQA